MDSEVFKAWAIDTRSYDGRGFIGKYWWFEHKPPQIPKHMEGCKLALFKTRALARLGLPSVRRTFPEARVVKVSVKIEF